MGKSHKITTFKSIGKSIGKSSINGPSFSCDYEDARISPAQLLALVFFGIQGQRALAHVAASKSIVEISMSDIPYYITSKKSKLVVFSAFMSCIGSPSFLSS